MEWNKVEEMEMWVAPGKITGKWYGGVFIEIGTEEWDRIFGPF